MRCKIICKYVTESYKQIYLNEPAVNARVKEIIQKASLINGCNRVAWLIRAVTCLDLTTLGGDDTLSSIEKLCKKVTKKGRKSILNSGILF